MALTVTIGSTTADSYGTQEEATAYFTSTGRADRWTAIVNAARDESSLRLAMLLIEAQDYIGERANASGVMQSLEFPRSVTNYRGRDATTLGGTTWTDKRGREWTSLVIPTPIKHAQFEQALAMAENDQWLNDRYSKQEVSAGNTTVKVRVGSDLALCLAAKLLVRPFLAATHGGVIRN